jgi:hypothetical protein
MTSHCRSYKLPFLIFWSSDELFVKNKTFFIVIYTDGVYRFTLYCVDFNVIDL